MTAKRKNRIAWGLALLLALLLLGGAGIGIQRTYKLAFLRANSGWAFHFRRRGRFHAFLMGPTVLLWYRRDTFTP